MESPRLSHEISDEQYRRDGGILCLEKVSASGYGSDSNEVTHNLIAHQDETARHQRGVGQKGVV